MKEIDKAESTGTVYYKPVRDFFVEAGYDTGEPINFGRVNEDQEIQKILRKLKNHPREMIYSFVEKELDKRKTRRIELRTKRRDLYEEMEEVGTEVLRHGEYFKQSDETLERRYEDDVKHDIIKAMKWFDVHILNQSTSS